MSTVFIPTVEDINKAVREAIRAELGAIAGILRSTEPGSHKGKYMTKREAANLSRCSMRTIENRMKEGLYRFSKPSPRKVLLFSEDVYGLINRDLKRVEKRGELA